MTKSAPVEEFSYFRKTRRRLRVILVLGVALVIGGWINIIVDLVNQPFILRIAEYITKLIVQILPNMQIAPQDLFTVYVCCFFALALGLILYYVFHDI